MIRSEVIIVGGGPAGAACAGRLAQAGVECLVLEARDFPRDKVCAGWITPEVIADVHLEPGEYPGGLRRFDRIRFHGYGIGIPVPTRQFAIRRREFDDWLLRRSGATVHRHRVKDIERRDGGYILDDRYRCRVLVGAGGTGCPVYRNLFSALDPRRARFQVMAMEAEFPMERADDECRLWFFEDGLPGYAWYVPKANGFVNIGVGGLLETMKRQGRTIRHYWGVLERLLKGHGLPWDSGRRPRGHTYYLARDLSVAQIGNAYLVGDALGLATRDMGEGIGPAVKSGIMAADAIVRGSAYTPNKVSRYSIPRMILARWKRG